MSTKQEKKPPEDKKARVSRYRAGREPEWGKDKDQYEEEEEQENEEKIDIKVERKQDARIERLQRVSRVDRDEAIRKRREIVAEVVSVAEEVKKEEPVEEEHHGADERRRAQTEDQEAEGQEEIEMDIDSDEEARRDRARLMYLRRKNEEDEMLPIKEEEEEVEEASEYETDSEYEEDEAQPVMKPTFVPKEQRGTTAVQEELDLEYERLEKLKIKQKEERLVETRRLVSEEKQREKEEAAKAEEDDEKVLSDEEEENEAKEYELWKLREITRIKRDKEEKIQVEKEREETEKRRNMSDLEIKQIDKEKFIKDKKKWKFLQKYYHAGAFFKEGEEGDVQVRDYSGATGEDLIDKTLLPKVMQVKNFGRSGRTKYTHLVDQDTTDWKAGWATNDSLSAKYNQKLGGMHGSIDKPSLKRKHT